MWLSEDKVNIQSLIKSKAISPNLLFSSGGQETQDCTRLQTPGSKMFSPSWVVVTVSLGYAYVQTHDIVYIKHVIRFCISIKPQ